MSGPLIRLLLLLLLLAAALPPARSAAVVNLTRIFWGDVGQDARLTDNYRFLSDRPLNLRLQQLPDGCLHNAIFRPASGQPEVLRLNCGPRQSMTLSADGLQFNIYVTVLDARLSDDGTRFRFSADNAVSSLGRTYVFRLRSHFFWTTVGLALLGAVFFAGLVSLVLRVCRPRYRRWREGYVYL